jgi:hypothetical protein
VHAFGTVVWLVRPFARLAVVGVRGGPPPLLPQYTHSCTETRPLPSVRLSARAGTEMMRPTGATVCFFAFLHCKSANGNLGVSRRRYASHRTAELPRATQTPRVYLDTPSTCNVAGSVAVGEPACVRECAGPVRADGFLH